jgi:hypothetical protein
MEAAVWKPLYGSHLWKHERRDRGRHACKWKLLLHAVAAQLAPVAGCKQTKAVSVTKKSDKPAAMRSNANRSMLTGWNRAIPGGHMGRTYFSR